MENTASNENYLVVTSGDGNGYTMYQVTASWVPYRIHTITLSDTIIPPCEGVKVLHLAQMIYTRQPVNVTT